MGNKTGILELMVILAFILSLVCSAATNDSYTSPHWAGYIAVSNFSSPLPVVSEINGSWRLQASLPTDQPTFSAQWIGIGGALKGDQYNLIQIGTFSFYNQTGQHYKLFNESIYPPWDILNSKTPEFFNLSANVPIKPGDIIYASISLTGSQNVIYCEYNSCNWTLFIKDASENNESATRYINYLSSLLSAEWIDEAPNCGSSYTTSCSGGDSYTTISNFGVSHFGTGNTDIKSDYAKVNSSNLPIGALDNYWLPLTGSSSITAYPTSLINNTTFNVIEYGEPHNIDVPNPKPLNKTITPGQSSVLFGGTILYGSSYYSYQWLESRPANTLAFTSNTNCVAPMTSICYFITSVNTF